MGTTRIRVDLDDPSSFPKGYIDHAVVDNTTEEEIAEQEREDEAEAMRDAARYARRVRRRLGLTQVELARRIDVPLETIRNWEQGKRGPAGAGTRFAADVGQGSGGRSPHIDLRRLRHRRSATSWATVRLGNRLVDRVCFSHSQGLNCITC